MWNWLHLILSFLGFVLFFYVSIVAPIAAIFGMWNFIVFLVDVLTTNFDFAMSMKIRSVEILNNHPFLLQLSRLGYKIVMIGWPIFVILYLFFIPGKFLPHNLK